jgi:hypothetical protein
VLRNEIGANKVKKWLNQHRFEVISTQKCNVMLLNQGRKLTGFAKSNQRKGISYFYQLLFYLLT